MAKRLFLAQVIGSGSMSDPYRANVPPGTNHIAVIASNDDGTPRLPWCLVKVARGNNDFTDLDGDGQIDGFPVYGLNVTVAELPAGVRNRMRNALERRGIDTSDVSGQTTLRQIVRRIGRLLDEHFHEDRIDVIE